MNVDPETVVSAADLFGSRARPDTIEVSVDLVYELSVYAKTLAYLLAERATGKQLTPKAVEALAQLDGFRHFKELLKGPLASCLVGENGNNTIAVESADSSALAEQVLIESGYFRRPNRGLFLERTDCSAG